MNSLTARLTQSPILARATPFLLFLVLTAGQGAFGESGRYWVYFIKTVVGGWMLWTVRHVVTEMRWKLSWEAVIAGIAVFIIWVGLSYIAPTQQELWVSLSLSKAPVTPPPSWNPLLHFGDRSIAGWLFVTVRLLGSSIVVPPLEEVFYRSFLYRWIVRPDFESVPLGHFQWKPFLITAVIFGFAHNEWLAGILCAAVYQGLVCRKNRLGDAITAHAVTNFLLGVWVIWQGAWHFW
jgi:uncharacterized protein